MISKTSIGLHVAIRKPNKVLMRREKETSQREEVEFQIGKKTIPVY